MIDKPKKTILDEVQHSKPNEDNSPTKQALIELERAGVDFSKINSIDDIDTNTFLEADIAFDNKQYPDKRITFTKIFNLMTNKAFYSLNNSALAILFVMMCTMSQTYNMVCISQTLLQRLAHIPKKNTLIKNIGLLQDLGFIKIVSKGTRALPTIYEVNPDCAQSGKPHSKYNPDKEWPFFKDLDPDIQKHYNVIRNINFSEITVKTIKDTYLGYKYNLISEEPRLISKN